MVSVHVYSPFISLGISWENLFKHHHISLAILHYVTLQGKLKGNHLNMTKGFPITASNMIIHPVGMLNNIIDTKTSQWFSYCLICSECHPSCCHSSHTSLQVLSSSWQTFSLHWRWAGTVDKPIINNFIIIIIVTSLATVLW